MIALLETYGFDGVDLDWEYPGADDRGGVDADYDNYVSFLANLRTALDNESKVYGSTITLPSSYWYLQHFDMVNLVKRVDWVCRVRNPRFLQCPPTLTFCEQFNMMAYDLCK